MSPHQLQSLSIKASKGVVMTCENEEEWKKSSITEMSALVVDEAHMHASPLFTKGRSQLATKTYNCIKSIYAFYIK
jgi:hypothetical protein